MPPALSERNLKPSRQASERANGQYKRPASASCAGATSRAEWMGPRAPGRAGSQRTQALRALDLAHSRLTRRHPSAFVLSRRVGSCVLLRSRSGPAGSTHAAADIMMMRRRAACQWPGQGTWPGFPPRQNPRPRHGTRSQSSCGPGTTRPRAGTSSGLRLALAACHWHGTPLVHSSLEKYFEH
jgi:hypothetical protein